MKQLDEIRRLVLEAREERYTIRKSFAERKKNSISLSLNVPGYPKSNETISSVFSHILVHLHRHLTAHRVFICKEEEFRCIDEAGDFYIAPLLDNISQKAKAVGEMFEEIHPLGRLVDIDITDGNFNPVSSGKAKACFICKTEPAVACMRRNTHSKQELRDYIFAHIKNFQTGNQRRDLCRSLSQSAVKALLYEVSLTPKPGAVDRIHCGSHQDMDYITFLNSTAAISGYFRDLCTAGYDFHGSPGQALPAVR